MKKDLNNEVTSINTLIKTLIGLSIMLFGRYLPAPSIVAESSERLINMGFPLVDNGVLITISPVGMTVMSIFFGVIFLWATVDMIWPSLLAVFLVGISDYASMNDVLLRFLGSQTTAMIFFLFMFCAALIKSQVIAYIARWFMTRPFVKGKPWLFILVLFFGFYCVAFLGQMPALFLFLPILYAIFEELKLQKGDKLVTLLLVNTICMILCSFCSDTINGGGFFLLTNLYSLSSIEFTQEPLSYGAYLVFGFVISIIFMFLSIALMRFVYKVDVSALKKISPEFFNTNPLPPMTWQQKTLPFTFLFYAAWMLLPSALPADNQIAIFLKQNQFGGSLLLVAVLTFIKFKNEQLINFEESNKAYPWSVFVLVASALFLGATLTAPITNISLYLEYLLRGLLDGLSMTVFALVLVFLGIFITNFTNSVVAGFIFSPIIVTIANVYNFNANVLLACFFYVVLFGMVTPAASPFAAVLHSNGWITRKDAIRYSFHSSLLLVFIVVCVGIPLAYLLF